MTITQLRRRLILVGGAALLIITGCLGLAVRANAAASPPSRHSEVTAEVTTPPLTQEAPTRVGGVVVAVAANACSPEELTVLASDTCG